MRFQSPWALLALLVVPLLLWRAGRRGGSGSLRFSSVLNAARAGASPRQRLLVLVPLLRVMALACLALALARPQQGLERVVDVNKGVAMEMVVDRSSSMGAELEYEAERMSRLDAVKRVFQAFVLGDRDLPGRQSDLVGMIAFARYPDTVCPLTLAHGVLPEFLESVKLVRRQSEDGTAIGDALALAAARLKTAEETLARQSAQTDKEYEIKSKVIILLTDGQNNCGRRRPVEAAKLAAKWGIKVYTIGVGGGESVVTVPGLFGNFKMPVGSGIDEATLKGIAEETGGFYRRADTAGALRSIYKEIDEMEKTEIESFRYVDFKEKFAPFALFGLALLTLEAALACTVFRKIP